MGTTRLERFVKSGWTVMHTYQSRDGEEIRMIETEVFRWIRKGLKLPRYLGREEMGALGGYSETFSAEDLEPEAVISKVNSILGNSTNESF